MFTTRLKHSIFRQADAIFPRVFQASTKRTWSTMYPLPCASRPLRGRLSPEKRNMHRLHLTSLSATGITRCILIVYHTSLIQRVETNRQRPS